MPRTTSGADVASLLDIDVVLEDRRVLFRLAGEVCVTTAPALRQRLGLAVDAHAPEVVVDLGGVTVLCAAGVSVLGEAGRRLADRGGRLRLRGAHGVVATVLRVTGLDDLAERERVLESRRGDGASWSVAPPRGAARWLARGER